MTDNHWRRTVDELPAEGVVVEVRSGLYFGKAVFAFGGWREWRNFYLWDVGPHEWRPIMQGESTND